MDTARHAATGAAAVAAVPAICRKVNVLQATVVLLLSALAYIHAHPYEDIPWPVPQPPSRTAQQRAAAAAAAVLGSTCSNKVPAGYIFLPDTRPAGFGLRNSDITGTGQYAWDLLIEACNKEPKCNAVGTNGWISEVYPRKWPTAPMGSMNAYGWVPREEDVPCTGTLMKKGLSCGQVSVCHPDPKSCRGSNTSAPWQYTCICKPGQKLSAEGYLCTSPPFNEDVVFVEDSKYPTETFRATAPPFRDNNVWVFKGSRLAVVLVINILATQEPAMAEFADLAQKPQDALPGMKLIVQNLQRVLAMFDKLISMSPPPPFEVYTAVNPTLDQRTPYEVSLTDTQDTYYIARFGSAGFLTTAPPLLDMFRAALKNTSVVSRATLRNIPLNYYFHHVLYTLDYATTNYWWSGHGYFILDAAMTIMILNRLPKLSLVGHPKNFTFGQLLDYWENTALSTLKQANYSWDSYWYQPLTLADDEAPARLMMSGVFVHLYRKYGQRRYSFLQRFFHSLYELADRVPHYVVDHDRFRENYFMAASIAAPDGDLLPFFTERLKWSISSGAIQYLRTKHNLPRRRRQQTQNNIPRR